MSFEHTNRKGDVYYLQSGQTRTGKTRYWFGRKLTGKPVESMPSGYEACEHPEHGVVTIRRAKPTTISAVERQMVEEGLRRYAGKEYCIVTVDGDSLVVHIAEMSKWQASRILRVLMDTLPNLAADALSPAMQELTGELFGISGYRKALRFEVSNAKKRTFSLQQWRSLGESGHWMWLDGPAPLPDLVRKCERYLPEDLRGTTKEI